MHTHNSPPPGRPLWFALRAAVMFPRRAALDLAESRRQHAAPQKLRFRVHPSVKRILGLTKSSEELPPRGNIQTARGVNHRVPQEPARIMFYIICFAQTQTNSSALGTRKPSVAPPQPRQHCHRMKGANSSAESFSRRARENSCGLFDAKRPSAGLIATEGGGGGKRAQ